MKNVSNRDYGRNSFSPPPAPPGLVPGQSTPTLCNRHGQTTLQEKPPFLNRGAGWRESGKSPVLLLSWPFHEVR